MGRARKDSEGLSDSAAPAPDAQEAASIVEAAPLVRAKASFIFTSVSMGRTVCHEGDIVDPVAEDLEWAKANDMVE